jgi:pimeloyl-ACP methyl ester carboxylesterase
MKSNSESPAPSPRFITRSEVVTVAGVDFEVSRAEASPPVPGPMIAAAHPADPFGPDTAGLLAKACRAPVICINPRGIGGSTPALGQQGLEQMVDDLEASRRHLGARAWVFWGMSGGGWLGQIYARKYPQALAGLILESACACFRLRLSDPDCLLSPLHPSWRPALEKLGLVGADTHADPTSAGTTWMEVAGIGSIWRRVDGPALLVAPFPVSPRMRATMPALWSFDARPWLSTLAIPTLVIAGADDPIVPLSHARALHDGIAGADLLVVQGAGHVPVTQGRPEIATAVQIFLRERVRERVR